MYLSIILFIAISINPVDVQGQLTNQIISRISENVLTAGSMPVNQAAGKPGRYHRVTRYVIPETTGRYYAEITYQEDSNSVTAEVKAKDIQIRYLLFLIFVSVIALIGIIFYYRKRVVYLQKVIDRNMNVAKSFGLESQMLLEDDEIGVQSEENAVPAHRHEAIFEKIKTLLTEKKIFRDADLSLGKVTEQVGSNRRYVSEAINKSTGMKFNDYINFHRINEAKKLIKEESSLSDVQYACGFKSRTSFYSAFKMFTHMTPSEYRKKQRKGNKV